MIKDDVARKIRALRSMTVEAGCTEEEAILAAQRAGQLLEKYNLSLSEVEVREEPIGKRTLHTGGRRVDHPIAKWLSVPIADLCNCKVWGDRKDDNITTVFFGTEADTQVAAYILELCMRAHDTEKAAYMRRRRGIGKSGGTSFSHGMGRRLAERINNMAQPKSNTTGRDLVVLKNALVEEKFQALNIRLRNSKSSVRLRDKGSADAGSRAADRVNITTGIGRNSTVRKIGHG